MSFNSYVVAAVLLCCKAVLQCCCVAVLRLTKSIEHWAWSIELILRVRRKALGVRGNIF